MLVILPIHYMIDILNKVTNEGIRVNAVRPGLIETEVHASGGDANRINRLLWCLCYAEAPRKNLPKQYCG